MISNVEKKLKFLTTLVLIPLFTLSCEKKEAPNPKEERLLIPELLADGQYGREGTPISFDLVASLPDPEYKSDRLNPSRYEGGSLSFACVGSCPEGLVVDPVTGVFSWNPSFDDAGVHFVTFSVTSGIFSAQKNIPFVISDSDRPPLFEVASEGVVLETAEMKPLTYQLLANDEDGDPTSFRCIRGCPRGIVVTPEGLISWTPDWDQAGEYEGVFEAVSRPELRQVVVHGIEPGIDSDQVRKEVEKETLKREKESTSRVSIRFIVSDSDRPVEFQPIEPKEVSEASLLRFVVLAKDPDENEIRFLCTSSCPKGFLIDAETGEVRWKPDYDQAGEYEIELLLVTLEDTRVSVFFKVTVLNTNRPPVLVRPSAKTVKEGELLSFKLDVSDPDKDDKFFFDCHMSCPVGLLVGGLDGRVSWIPDYEQSGHYRPVLSVSDGTATVFVEADITVIHVNRPPEWDALPSTFKLKAMSSISLSVLGKDPDKEDAGKLRYACRSCPTGMTIDAKTGKLTWRPSYDQDGVHGVVLSVSDGLLAVDGLTLIEVEKVDLPPQFSSAVAPDGEEFQPWGMSLFATDGDGDTVTYSCFSGCPEGLVVNPLTGALNWTPNGRQSGTHDIIFRATSAPEWDSSATKSGDLLLSVFIRNFNRPPTIDAVATTFYDIYEGGHLTHSHQSATGFGFKLDLFADDPDGDPLTYRCYANCPAGLNVNPVTGEVSWVPDYDQAMPGETPYVGIELGVSDGTVSVRTNAIRIRVRNVNRPPVISLIDDMTVFEKGHRNASETSPLGFPLRFFIPGADADGTTLIFGCHENCPTGLTVNQQTGEVNWNPTYDQAKGGEQSLPYDGIVYSVSDGELTSLSTPHKIRVVNVNRAPRPLSVQASYQIFEMGHVSAEECPDKTDDCAAFQSVPLDFTISTTDPDGDEITYECAIGSCPRGLTVDQSTGRVFWRPSYIQTLVSDAAKAGNAPYGNVQFVARDFKDSTLSNPTEIVVKNVDRSPRPAALSAKEFFEMTPATFWLDVRDPDGDLVAFECATVKIPFGSPRLLLAPPPVEDCQLGYEAFPNFGHKRWLTVGRLSGEVSIFAGFYDALKGDDAFTVTYRYVAAPLGFPALPAKTVTQEHQLKLKNIDQAPTIAKFKNKIPVYESLGTSQAIPLYFADDPDSLYGEFMDSQSFSCVGEVDLAGNVIAPCPDGVTVDSFSGGVSWAPSFTQARYNEAPYRLRFKVSSSPDGFSTSPLESTTTLEFVVLNNDRLPKFCESGVTGQPPVCSGIETPSVIHVWEPGPATAGNSPKTRPEFPGGPSTYPTSATVKIGGYDPDNLDSEPDSDEEVSFVLLGCSNVKDATSNFFDCQAAYPWLSFDSQTGTLSVTNPPYDAARPYSDARYLVFEARSCPKAETGFECRMPEHPGEWQRKEIALHVNNVDRRPVVSVTTSPSASVAETAAATITVTVSDPDGDPVAPCLSVTPSSLFSKLSVTANGQNFTSCPGTELSGSGSVSFVVTVQSRNEINRASGGGTGKENISYNLTAIATPYLQDTAALTSPVVTLSSAFTDVDRPATASAETIKTTNIKETGETIRAMVTLCDEDSHDQSHLAAKYLSATNSCAASLRGFTAASGFPKKFSTSGSCQLWHVDYVQSLDFVDKSEGTCNYTTKHQVCYDDVGKECFPAGGVSAVLKLEHVPEPPEWSGNPVQNPDPAKEPDPIILYLNANNKEGNSLKVVVVSDGILSLSSASSSFKTQGTVRWSGNHDLSTSGTASYTVVLRICDNVTNLCTSDKSVNVFVLNSKRPPTLTLCSTEAPLIDIGGGNAALEIEWCVSDPDGGVIVSTGVNSYVIDEPDGICPNRTTPEAGCLGEQALSASCSYTPHQHRAFAYISAPDRVRVRFEGSYALMNNGTGHCSPEGVFCQIGTACIGHDYCSAPPGEWTQCEGNPGACRSTGLVPDRYFRVKSFSVKTRHPTDVTDEATATGSGYISVNFCSRNSVSLFNPNPNPPIVIDPGSGSNCPIEMVLCL